MRSTSAALGFLAKYLKSGTAAAACLRISWNIGRIHGDSMSLLCVNTVYSSSVRRRNTVYAKSSFQAVAFWPAGK